MHVEIDHAVAYEPLEHFAPWEAVDHLSSACALSYDANGDYMSVGRNDGSISIYELREIPLPTMTFDLCIELGGASLTREYSCSCMAWLCDSEALGSTHIAAVFARPDRTDSIVCVWNLRSRNLINIVW
jgi:WD40 repeat protein